MELTSSENLKHGIDNFKTSKLDDPSVPVTPPPPAAEAIALLAAPELPPPPRALRGACNRYSGFEIFKLWLIYPKDIIHKIFTRYSRNIQELCEAPATDNQDLRYSSYEISIGYLVRY